MKKVILVITLLSAVVLVSTCAKRESLTGEGKCKLKFEAIKNRRNMLVLCTQYLASGVDKPSELKDLPKGVTADYVYFLAKMAGKNSPMVLSSYSTLKHSILYVDTNCDGRLSDEKGFNNKIIQRPEFNAQEYGFGPISVKCSDSEKEFETSFLAVTGNGQHLTLYPDGYYAGVIRLGRKTYKVAVVDGNFDGRYDKIFSTPVENILMPGSDSFAIDLDRDGKWDFNLFYNHSEIMPLAKMVKVGNSYYTINFAKDGTSLELNKIQPEFGTLNLGNVSVKLKLFSDTAHQYISSLKNSGQLPTGMYQAYSIELSQIDSEKKTWTFTSYQNTGALCDFEIRRNETTSFKIGLPFQIKTTVRKIRDNLNIDFKLVGQASEKYGPDFKKNGKRISPPEIRIIDEDSNVIHSGQAKYG